MIGKKKRKGGHSFGFRCRPGPPTGRAVEWFRVWTTVRVGGAGARRVGDPAYRWKCPSSSSIVLGSLMIEDEEGEDGADGPAVRPCRVRTDHPVIPSSCHNYSLQPRRRKGGRTG